MFLVVVLLVGTVQWVCAMGTICPACGHEQPDESTQCDHCGAAWRIQPVLTRPADDGLELSVRLTSAEGWTAVSNEVLLAHERHEQGDLDVAIFLFRNAMALISTMEANEQRESVSRQIHGAIDRLRKSTGKVRRTCLACAGTGKRFLELAGLDGTIKRTDSGQPCHFCNGRKVVQAEERPQERQYRVGMALRRYVELQRSRHYVSLGEVWIPESFTGKLTSRQIARMRNLCAPRCEVCSGGGNIACTECEGRGDLSCSNRECRNGKVERIQKGMLSPGDIRATSICPVCKGMARVICHACRGNGQALCDACKGSGESEPCKRCGGDGLVDCRDCKGVGQKDTVPCARCRSEGVTLCDRCDGNGCER